MNRDDPPFYLVAQLKAAVTEARQLAEQKGLVSAFEMELFALDRTAEELQVTGDRKAVERAIANATALAERLRTAPGKNDPMLLR